MSKVALLINLGSPRSPGVKDVKEYLGEFLMDDHVIDVPKIPRWLLVKGIILNVRPKKSAEAYKSIWWDEGSPLIALSERLVKKVREYSDYETFLAMRYAAPSILNTLNEIHDKHPGLDELYVVPLYPHFAMSSYESVVDRVKQLVEEHYPGLKLMFKKPWFDEKSYINILTKSISEVLPKDHHLLFSYHGIPVRHLRKSDPTSCHCYAVDDCCNVVS
ncbi:MAG TPA: ferrochelatase, partial [Cryomorphaceae bacterium]|nr:ferrochelatase [Cryomorphaceae bacterium]HCY25936.1 ferrochelatase [Cryomorphaceae bacterium]